MNRELNLKPEHLPTSMSIVPTTPMEMLNRALMSGATPETLERLLALQERWEMNQARRAFDEAIAAARADIPPIKKNKTVSFGAGKTAYNHEDLAEIERTILPILSKHGISYRFRPKVEDKMIVVTCILSKGGYREENSLPGPADTSGSKNPIQAIGSTVTYLERITLKAALGLSATDDDDGVAASKTNGNGNGHLSDEQIEQLRSAIVDAGADVTRFCKVYGIERVEQLPARRLDEATAKLAAFKRQQEKAS